MERFEIKEHILQEDRHILVCYKPAGLPVQSAGLGRMDMESCLMNYLGSQNPGKMPFLGVVHRLDQPVEGVLVFAKNKKAAAELNRQSQNGRMKKGYLAVVRGIPHTPEGTLEDYLLKDGRANRSRIVPKGTPGSKLARLHYRTLESQEECSLLEIILDTGRHHQIRVQMSGQNLPLMGDRKYGDDESAANVALCAYSLAFDHPVTGKKLHFQVRPKGEIFQSFSCSRE